MGVVVHFFIHTVIPIRYMHIPKRYKRICVFLYKVVDNDIQKVYDDHVLIKEIDMDEMTELENIVGVEGVVLENGKTRISAVMTSGEKEVLLKGSKRKPELAQMYSKEVNGNVWGESLGKHFLFVKTVDSWERENHLKTFKVDYLN